MIAHGDARARIIRAWQKRERGSAECERAEAWSQRALVELEIAEC